MRYAAKHATMAAVMAHYPNGVTAKELASVIGKSERLSRFILKDLADTRPDEFGWIERRSRRPGQRSSALFAIN